MRNIRGYWPKIALAELTDVDDSGVQQVVSHYGFQGEQHTEVYRPQPHGFTSRPPKGSTGVIFSLGGERSRSVFMGGESDAARPTGLNEGECKLYDPAGNMIYCAMKNGVKYTTAQGDTVVTTSNGNTTIDTPQGTILIAANKDIHAYSDGIIHLGSRDGSNTFRVATEGGYSSKVKAAL